MTLSRPWQHILFWLSYYLVSLYNELYLSVSFSQHPDITLFLQSALSVLLLLAVKMGVAYVILYTLLPRWQDGKAYSGEITKAVLVVLAGTLLMRLVTQFVVWPFVYREEHAPIPLTGMLARYFYSLFDLLLITGLAVCIKLFKLRIQSVKHERNLVLERSRAEILHLKTQTNPHFLFNTLNSIYALARGRSEATPDAILRLSKILRYTLYDSDKRSISIGEELKIVNDYIELQQLRFGKRIEMKLSTDIDSSAEQVTPLLLLPLVENAYKHCDENEAVIEFHIRMKNEVLTVQTNNPTGETSASPQGSGLQNLRRQLELLYRDFKLEHGVKEKRFHLDLMINLRSYAGHELFDTGR